MINLVRERLEAFGYEFGKRDEGILKAAVRKAENNVRCRCGVCYLPEELLDAAVDMAAGEFLFIKKASAPEDIKCVKLDAAVKRLDMGDTSVAFAVGEGCLTEEQRLDAFIDYLLNSGKELFPCFRRIRW